MQLARTKRARCGTLIDAFWKLKSEPSTPADYDADYSCIISEYSRQDFYAAIEMMLEMADGPLHREKRYIRVGRIRSLSRSDSDWIMIDWEPGMGLPPGSMIRIGPIADPVHLRTGEARVVDLGIHAVRINGEAWSMFPAIAELDYVYREDR